MYTVLVVTQVLVAIALIGLVLIQHGKGADAGAAFGSGASGTVFGARGAANFLTRSTAWLAAAFFICSLGLAYMVAHRTTSTRSIVDTIEAAPRIEAPTAVAPAATMGDAPVAVEPAVPQNADEAPSAPQ